MLACDQKKLWTKEFPLVELAHSCALVGEELRHSKPFCLWLQGEVGAGKTSWVAEFFYCLGLARDVAVTSPTFIYARAYDIGGKLYNHCDLYRIDNLVAYHALGIEADNYHGMLLEWAATTNCATPPTHRLHIEFSQEVATRRYVFYRSEQREA